MTSLNHLPRAMYHQLYATNLQKLGLAFQHSSKSVLLQRLCEANDHNGVIRLLSSEKELERLRKETRKVSIRWTTYQFFAVLFPAMAGAWLMVQAGTQSLIGAACCVGIFGTMGPALKVVRSLYTHKSWIQWLLTILLAAQQAGSLLLQQPNAWHLFWKGHFKITGWLALAGSLIEAIAVEVLNSPLMVQNLFEFLNEMELQQRAVEVVLQRLS